MYTGHEPHWRRVTLYKEAAGHMCVPALDSKLHERLYLSNQTMPCGISWSFIHYGKQERTLLIYSGDGSRNSRAEGEDGISGPDKGTSLSSEPVLNLKMSISRRWLLDATPWSPRVTEISFRFVKSSDGRSEPWSCQGSWVSAPNSLMRP